MIEQQEQKAPPLDVWAVVELMGHIKLAGKLTEESHCGAVLGRLDIPLDGDKWLTQFFGGSAVFRITPTDEATARAVAANCAPAPISRYEMPKQLAHKEAPSESSPGDYDRSDEDHDDDDEPSF